MRLFSLLLAIWLTGTAAALDVSDPAAAEPELQSLVNEWESAWQADRSAENAAGLGASLQALGIIQRQLAKPKAAEANLRRACTVMEGRAPSLLTDAREGLALALQDQGKFGESEALLRQVLEARRTVPSDPLPLALSLDHLALSLLLQGRYGEVGSLLDEAIGLLPEDQLVERARLIGHLGRLHHTLGSHAKAISHFDEAMSIPFENPELRLSLRAQRALATLRLGRTEEGVADTEAVADDARTLLADSPLLAVPYINNLGALSLSLGRPDEAVQAFGEARDLLIESVGEDHPALAGVHHNLGVALQQAGDLDEARMELMAAARLHDRYLEEDHLRVAETRRDLAVNAVLRGSPDARQLARSATEGGLKLLEELVEGGTETQRLNFIERFDLVSLPCALGDPELIADTLLASKARLLDVLIGGDRVNPPTWRDISEALPEHSAFVDFCRHRPLDAGEPDRLGAVVIVARARPQWVDLGTVPELHRWLDVLKSRLDWNAARLSGESPPAPALTLAGALRFLHQLFWEPVEDLIPGEVRNLAVSLDGAAHFLPLAALLDADDELLCRRYDQLTRVASGRDLLRDRPLPEIASSPWSVLSSTDHPPSTKPAARQPRPGSLVGELATLPGTAEEARVLERLAPARSTFLRGDQVSEAAVTSLPKDPAVLHFGGHAFFTGSNRTETPLDFDLQTDRLFASGLVLHRGIERLTGVPREDASDDLLFPLEIARMELGNTRLVSLSSCDSGLGTSVDGEGILGLQRAFAVAGASEVLYALWPVSDQSTPEFMGRFYELAIHSDRTAQSLWQAQAELLSGPDDPEFESAVLRFAPFALNQSHALRTGPPISYSKSPGPAWWLVILAALPLIIFGLVRATSRKASNS